MGKAGFAPAFFVLAGILAMAGRQEYRPLKRWAYLRNGHLYVAEFRVFAGMT